MTAFLVKIFGDVWGTAVMSFIPLIELKGGILFAHSVNLGFIKSFVIAYLGSTAAFFLVFFLLVPILNLLKKIRFIKTFADKVELYFKRKAKETLEKRADKNNGKITETFIKQIGVFIFVAIPLPMTGVWTGTAVAVFLNLKFKEAVLPVILGNVVAGLIISALAVLFKAIWTVKALDYVLYALFAIAFVLLIVFIVKVCKQKADE